MGFFDDIGSQPRTRRSWPRPDGQLPVPMATRLLLARTDQAAIAVVGLWAFTAGFEFQVSVQLRAAVPGTSAASFLSALDGEPLEDEFLRLGIQFSTGEKAANTELRATRETGREPLGPTMTTRVAGAGALSRDWRYWVSPLPPSGPLAFVCAWPAFGIAESRAELEAEQILAAARDSIDLWPRS
jgi:hypothetical protein